MRTPKGRAPVDLEGPTLVSNRKPVTEVVQKALRRYQRPLPTPTRRTRHNGYMSPPTAADGSGSSGLPPPAGVVNSLTTTAVDGAAAQKKAELERRRLEDERLQRDFEEEEEIERLKQESEAETRRVEAERLQGEEYERLRAKAAQIEAARLEVEQEMKESARRKEQIEAERVEAAKQANAGRRRQADAGRRERHNSVSSVGSSFGGSNVSTWVRDLKEKMDEILYGYRIMVETGAMTEEVYQEMRTEEAKQYVAQIKAGRPSMPTPAGDGCNAKGPGVSGNQQRPSMSNASKTAQTPVAAMPAVYTIADTRYRQVKFPADIAKLTGREPKKDGLRWWNRLVQFRDGQFYPKADVLKAVNDLMVPESDAHQWYRSLGGKRSNWEQLEAAFLAEFCPDEAEIEKLKAELCQKEQGCTMNFKRFTRELEASNEELGYPLTPEQILKAAYNNMLPEYRNFVKKDKYRTMEQLRVKVCGIEKADIESRARKAGFTREQINCITTTEELHEAMVKLEVSRRPVQQQSQTFPKKEQPQPKREYSAAVKTTTTPEVKAETVVKAGTEVKPTAPVTAAKVEGTVRREYPRKVCLTPGANESGYDGDVSKLKGFRAGIFCFHCDREGFTQDFCRPRLGDEEVTRRYAARSEAYRQKLAAEQGKAIGGSS